MPLLNPLVLAIVASTVVGGGAVVGYHMMDAGDDVSCHDMQGMGHMGGQMMSNHDDGAAHHDAMMADMDEMHARCHATMEHHHGGNATGGHEHGAPGEHGR